MKDEYQEGEGWMNTWKENVGAWLAPAAWTTLYTGVIPRDWNLS